MRVQVNLSDVQSFESLPVGAYLGTIEKAERREARQEGKFAQIMVTYQVIDEGDSLGQKQSEFLSLSPKAAFRLKKFFDHFGLGDTDDLEFDDDTGGLIDPDIVGSQVIFKVYADGTKLGTDEVRYSVSLVSVEEAPIQRAKAAPEPELTEAEPEDPKAAARAALEAQLAALDDADEPTAEAAKPAKAKLAKTPAPAVAATRRSLR